MGMTSMGSYRVSRSKPKISVRIINNAYDTAGVKLLLTRVGEHVAFVEYYPTRVTTDYFEFMFDDLLFDRTFGRYLGQIIMEGAERAYFYIQYINDVVTEVKSDA